jgi:GDP-mannose 6-dehydrogenase
MNISIFGLGYVGCVSVGCLSKMRHNVIGVDINEEKVSMINNGKATIIEKDIDNLINDGWQKKRISATTDAIEAVINSEISFISVGTPSSESGELNLEYVYEVANQISYGLRQKNENHIIAVRSTVKPGTCEKIKKVIDENIGENSSNYSVVSNPEFLREGSAVYDYFNPPLTIIGVTEEYARQKLINLYKDLPCEIYTPNIREAEIMKYINNSFHALKISFANEIGNICKAMDINGIEVMKLLTEDKKLNISPYYLKPGFAYGGSCLPKDLMGLQTLAKSNNLQTPLLDSISKANHIQKERLISLIESLKLKNIGIIGIAFKDGTDDLRNSPILYVIQKLLDRGFKIMIYDETVSMKKITGVNKFYIKENYPQIFNLFTDSKESLISNNNVIIINTDDIDIIKLNEANNKIHIVDLVSRPKIEYKYKRYHGINW